VKHFFKQGVFVGNISDPDTWDVSEEIKKAAPKQSDAEREKEEQLMKEFFPDAPRVSDIPRLMKKAAKNDVCRLRGGGAYENRVNLGGGSHRGSRGRGGRRGRDMAKRSRNDQPAEEELSDEGPEQSYVPLHPFDRYFKLILNLMIPDIINLQSRAETENITGLRIYMLPIFTMKISGHYIFH
jgi:hypothetical protein